MKAIQILLKNTISQRRYCLHLLSSQINNTKPLLFSTKPLLNPSLISPKFYYISSFETCRYFSTSDNSSSLIIHDDDDDSDSQSSNIIIHHDDGSHSSGLTIHDKKTYGDIINATWEDDEGDDLEPEFGDGGSGGGIVLRNVPWGEKVLSIALEVLLQYNDDIKLFAFKATPKGFIYLRLHQQSKKYGCPDMELLESYNLEFVNRLKEEGSEGQIPNNLGVEVGTPGANRLLRVPDDLHEFKEFPMVVSYVEDEEDVQTKTQEKTEVFFLDSIEAETEQCIWKLADVRANRDPASKGKPLNRKQRDWRLKLPYKMVKKVYLYFE